MPVALTIAYIPQPLLIRHFVYHCYTRIWRSMETDALDFSHINKSLLPLLHHDVSLHGFIPHRNIWYMHSSRWGSEGQLVPQQLFSRTLILFDTLLTLPVSPPPPLLLP